jgi:hypothetical protein
MLVLRIQSPAAWGILLPSSPPQSSTNASSSLALIGRNLGSQPSLTLFQSRKRKARQSNSDDGGSCGDIDVDNESSPKQPMENIDDSSWQRIPMDTSRKDQLGTSTPNEISSLSADWILDSHEISQPPNRTSLPITKTTSNIPPLSHPVIKTSFVRSTSTSLFPSALLPKSLTLLSQYQIIPDLEASEMEMSHNIDQKEIEKNEEKDDNDASEFTEREKDLGKEDDSDDEGADFDVELDSEMDMTTPDPSPSDEHNSEKKSKSRRRASTKKRPIVKEKTKRVNYIEELFICPSQSYTHLIYKNIEKMDNNSQVGFSLSSPPINCSYSFLSSNINLLQQKSFEIQSISNSALLSEKPYFSHMIERLHLILLEPEESFDYNIAHSLYFFFFFFNFQFL